MVALAAATHAQGISKQALQEEDVTRIVAVGAAAAICSLACASAPATTAADSP